MLCRHTHTAGSTAGDMLQVRQHAIWSCAACKQESMYRKVKAVSAKAQAYRRQAGVTGIHIHVYRHICSMPGRQQAAQAGMQVLLVGQ